MATVRCGGRGVWDESPAPGQSGGGRGWGWRGQRKRLSCGQGEARKGQEKRQEYVEMRHSGDGKPCSKYEILGTGHGCALGVLISQSNPS